MRKPKLIISKCLDSNKCRYDGQGYNDKTVQALKLYVDINHVCPECEIGLSTPRNPIRIENHNDTLKLIEHKTKLEHTNTMNEFASEFINKIDDIDGFILKSKSPSCGIKDAKVYMKDGKCSIRNNESGFFSKKIIDTYPHLPIENEGRLKNYSIRDNFFTKIFLINEFKSQNNLKSFNNDNSLLFKTYCEEGANQLQKIASMEHINEDNKKEYSEVFYKIINNKRDKNKKLQIVDEIFLKYKNNLNTDESKVFYELIEQYKNDKIPYSTLLAVIRMYAARFKDKGILNQRFFNPYPEGLISISDSGKGRNI
ncbi:MAG: YbgA family protein [Peptostreptococcaceae bacterium]